ncbi:MAG: hypothetical protein Q7R92_04000 [bacterium]|nr:hypothetical protein [bacterium]
MTDEVKKEEVVVRTDNGMAKILSGGYLIGCEDGVTMACSEFNRKIPIGLPCLYNHRDSEDERLKRIFSRRNGV